MGWMWDWSCRLEDGVEVEVDTGEREVRLELDSGGLTWRLKCRLEVGF